MKNRPTNKEVASAEIARANKAKRVLEDELVVEAREALMANYERKLDQRVSDEELRDIYHERRACKAFFRHFERLVQTGKLAEVTLEEIQAKEARENERRK